MMDPSKHDAKQTQLASAY